MPVTLINPSALSVSELYHQVSVATGSRTVYVAGQVGTVDHDGQPLTDLADQVTQCFLNVAAALAEAGATFDDVARMTVYFVDWTPDKVEPYQRGIDEATRRLGIDQPTPPLTGIGVAALAEPNVLVELEAIAVLP